MYLPLCAIISIILQPTRASLFCLDKIKNNSHQLRSDCAGAMDKSSDLFRYVGGLGLLRLAQCIFNLKN